MTIPALKFPRWIIVTAAVLNATTLGRSLVEPAMPGTLFWGAMTLAGWLALVLPDSPVDAR